MLMRIQNNKPLDDGYYQAVLKSIEEKETIFGDRLMWLLEDLEHGVEVAGFTSLSPSTQANAYKWAVALNPNIQNQRSWSEEDVVGKECILKLEVVEGAKGPKNKIVEVLPLEQE
jgi:hypothetical protein